MQPCHAFTLREKRDELYKLKKEEEEEEDLGKAH